MRGISKDGNANCSVFFRSTINAYFLSHRFILRSNFFTQYRKNLLRARVRAICGLSLDSPTQENVKMRRQRGKFDAIYLRLTVLRILSRVRDKEE